MIHDHIPVYKSVRTTISVTSVKASAYSSQGPDVGYWGKCQ